MTGLHPLESRFDTEAITILTRAFLEDPLYVAVESLRDRREKIARSIATLYLCYCRKWGEVSGIIENEKLVSVMILLPPEEYDLTLGKLIRCGALRIPFSMGFRAYKRLAGVDRVAEKAHREDTTRPHWYLLMIAVDPERKGGGFASAVLKPFLSYCDEHSLPVYLDTHNRDNIALYTHFGFSLQSSTPIPGLMKVFHYSMLYHPHVT